ncbi:aspartate aminotransferase family protein [Neptunomonas antarctica]|uniref:Adenosylmethionine-8-amino-7-oxononanoate aminotransferase n=1 Tax=Neptunomonas antarctica TaxID=619304 RepID=A0A1N7NVM5_9GAMM|nr:aspartate aminotransferase family protein [Neptunomonas antarctica]SIT02351.1 Adenosylmethionine-8-amino-7-oxononanoate aminotransferase [Neptunomonas antarctica]
MSNNALFYLTSDDMPVVSHADGIYIWDTKGRRYIDGCSGAITCNIGHNHPTVKRAMAEQLDKIAFSYRTQFESQVALDLADRLVDLTDGDLDKVFFVGSGSEAVESAIKLAVQYFVAKEQPERCKFVSLRPSYHGSTMGALGLTGYEPLEAPYRSITIGSVKVPSPDLYRYKETSIEEHITSVLEQTEKAILAAGAETIAAVVLEPVGGASTGGRIVTKRYMEGLRALCDRYGCLLIMDEVLSGMGRTGAWFAYQHFGVVPDILALAKGLGSGYYPIAAMMARKELVDVVGRSGGFMHGHTYAGNPLACATGLAVIDVMESEQLVSNSLKQGSYLRQQLEQLALKYDCIGNVRGIGLLQGVELVRDKTTKEPYPAAFNAFAKITSLAKDRGLLIYPRRCLNGLAGDHVLITPPLTVTVADIDEIITLLDESLAAFGQIVLEREACS